MGAAIQLNISYEQVLALVKQLPTNEKIKLTKALENEGIETKLAELLTKFQTDSVSMKTIDEEVELVRQQMYDDKKY